jgi:hypothetical protein
MIRRPSTMIMLFVSRNFVVGRVVIVIVVLSILVVIIVILVVSLCCMLIVVGIYRGIVDVVGILLSLRLFTLAVSFAILGTNDDLK